MNSKRSQVSLKDIAEAAALFVLLIGIVILWIVTDFSTTSSSSKNIGRFIYASMNIIAPTTEFAVFLEIGLAIVGGLTIGRENIKIYIFGMFVFYFLINFITAWFAAPV